MRSVYKLNDLGWFVWQNLDKKGDLESLVSLISGKYVLDRATASGDLKIFLENLIRAGALLLEERN